MWAVGVGVGLRCGGGRDGQFMLAVPAGSCGPLGHLCFIVAALARLLSGCCRGRALAHVAAGSGESTRVGGLCPAGCGETPRFRGA